MISMRICSNAGTRQGSVLLAPTAATGPTGHEWKPVNLEYGRSALTIVSSGADSILVAGHEGS